MTQVILRQSAYAPAIPGDLLTRTVSVFLKPLQLLMAWPTFLFLLTLAAMLLRHPDVSFYEIDRLAFGLLVAGVTLRKLVLREPICRLQRASLPMLALTTLAVASMIQQPFDPEAWSLIAAKFIVPFTLFHLATIVFTSQRSQNQFESFALVVLAYLSFTSIAFLAGAKSLIFPHFILDPGLGYHVDRARGPLLQAVANGVSLIMLGLLAVHAYCRGRLKGIKAAILMGSVPIAVLATMTRAVWLTFAGAVLVLAMQSSNRTLRRTCLTLICAGLAALAVVLSYPGWREALQDRLQERGPVEFRSAVYSGAWQMFLERPFTGWGVNQMPAELARHVSGYKERILYPHNTYLELLVEHGILGLLLYAWLIWELWKLRLGRTFSSRNEGFLSRAFYSLWPVLLGVYAVNASFVVMNYQFVNGLLFTIAGILAGQQHADRELACDVPGGGVLQL